jgi:hypothetical protein
LAALVALLLSAELDGDFFSPTGASPLNGLFSEAGPGKFIPEKFCEPDGLGVSTTSSRVCGILSTSKEVVYSIDANAVMVEIIGVAKTNMMPLTCDRSASR